MSPTLPSATTTLPSATTTLPSATTTLPSATTTLPSATTTHTPAYVEKLNAFIAEESKNLANLVGSNSFGNFPIPVGDYYEFFTAIYIQRKAELIIMSPARGDQVITDSPIVNMFMNRKVLSDLGNFGSSLIQLLHKAEIKELVGEHGFHKRDPNEAFCSDLMNAFEDSDPHVQARIDRECEYLNHTDGWFYILPARQQRQCLLKALAGILWLQTHSIISHPCTQSQVERTFMISKYLGNTAGLEPATYVEWLKG